MTASTSMEHPIDAVILWVDGEDENHGEKILPYLDDRDLANSRKFRTRFDQTNEIESTINSILKFAPYIDNIYIITDNQTPGFLKDRQADDRYSRVSIVDHTVIFDGYEQFLPTFNCRPIETCMHRIPNLAEHFIYFNDDFFLINNTRPDDFFRDGLPVLRGRWLKFDEDIFHKKFRKPKSGHKSIQQNAARLAGLDRYFNFRHTPHPLRKSTFKTFFENNESVLLDNIKHKFRHKDQFAPQGLANHLEIRNKTCLLTTDLQLLYFRSYKRPLIWYRFRLSMHSRGKLFLAMQSLDQCPQHILKYLMNWLQERMKLEA